MADPFGVIGVIGVAGQVIRFSLSLSLGLAWHDAPTEAKNLFAEL